MSDVDVPGLTEPIDIEGDTDMEVSIAFRLL